MKWASLKSWCSYLRSGSPYTRPESLALLSMKCGVGIAAVSARTPDLSKSRRTCFPRPQRGFSCLRRSERWLLEDEKRFDHGPEVTQRKIGASSNANLGMNTFSSILFESAGRGCYSITFRSGKWLVWASLFCFICQFDERDAKFGDRTKYVLHSSKLIYS